MLRAPIAEQRETLATVKARLGHAGTYALLRRELAVSELTSRAAVVASRGRTATSVTRLVAPGVAAERFAAWFNDLTASNREAAMLAACPDHYLLRGLPDGRQEVVETTGGAPTASRFLVDYTRTDRLSTAADPEYPIQIAGLALLDDGTCIGGVRHQLRDRGGALEALLTVEFPRRRAGPAPPAARVAPRRRVRELDRRGGNNRVTVEDSATWASSPAAAATPPA